MSNIHKIRRNLVIAFVILIVFVIYNIYHVLAPFVISSLLIYLLAPLVNLISSRDIGGKKLSRGLSVVVIYIVFFTIMIVSAIFIFPMLYEEGRKIASDIPKQINDFKNDTLPILIGNLQLQFDNFSIDVNLKEQFDKTLGSILSSGQGHFEEIPKLAQKIIGGLFSTMTSLVVIFIFTAFVLIDLPKLKEGIIKLFPHQYKDGLVELGTAINRDLNGAIRGQILICILNGILTTIGLFIMKVKYAVTLGIIAAICSLIPIFGTIFSLVPTVLVALTQSWFAAVEVIGLILLIHLIEANLFNPKIMGNSVELHPAIIMSSIFIGEHLFGMAGLLLGVPVVAIIRSVLIFIYTRYFFEDHSKIDYVK